MNDTLKLWLLGMGIQPEQIDTDQRLMQEIEHKDGVAAWQRLHLIRYDKGLSPYPEFDTPAAELEFISIVAGKLTTLWL